MRTAASSPCPPRSCRWPPVCGRRCCSGARRWSWRPRPRRPDRARDLSDRSADGRPAAWRPAGQGPGATPRSPDLPRRQRPAAVDVPRAAGQPAEHDGVRAHPEAYDSLLDPLSRWGVVIDGPEPPGEGAATSRAEAGHGSRVDPRSGIAAAVPVPVGARAGGGRPGNPAHLTRGIPVVQSGDTGSGRPGDDRAGGRAVRPAGPFDRQPQADRARVASTSHDVTNPVPGRCRSRRTASRC